MVNNDLQRQMEAVIVELEDWARWMQGYKMKLGYPSRSAGMESGYVSQSFDEMCEQADQVRCRIVDCAVNDLEAPALKAAIHHRYLGTVVRFPRNNLPELLLEAHIAVEKNLRKRGIDIG